MGTHILTQLEGICNKINMSFKTNLIFYSQCLFMAAWTNPIPMGRFVIANVSAGPPDALENIEKLRLWCLFLGTTNYKQLSLQQRILTNTQQRKLKKFSSV